MSREVVLCRHWLRYSSACLLLLILAVSLAGCGQQSVPTHTFAGKVQVIGVPTPFQIPMSIALGTDGNLWFPAIAYSHFGTSQPGGAIGRVMLNGKLRLYFLPTNCYPSYITRGPDGKLWFLATQGRG